MSPPLSARMNPWLSIWLRPRATIQHIVDTDPQQQVTLIAVLIGIVYFLENPLTTSLRVSLGFPLYPVLLIPAGAIVGLIGVHVGAMVVRWVGQWLGGRASDVHLRAALAWGQVPLVIGAIPSAIVQMFLIRSPEVGSTAWLDQRPYATGALVAVSSLVLVAAIWGAFTYAKAVAQVQGFSAWRALLNTLLAWLLLTLPFALIATVIWMMV